MNYGELKSHPRILQSLTGMSIEEFETLLPTFSAAWKRFVEETFLRECRKRVYGGGRNARLKLPENKLLFILVYFNLYPTQEVQGYLFGLKQTQANEWVHRLAGILNQTLGTERQLPERRPAKLAEVLKCYPALELFIDTAKKPSDHPK